MARPIHTLLTCLALCAVPVACGGDSGSHAGLEQNALPELRLDDGEKWQADAHTRESMRAITGIVTASDPISLDDHRDVGERVGKALEGLIAGCTMRGPAHDQLHVFLNRFMPKASALANADDVAAARALHTELEQLVAVYAEHFD